MLTVLLPNNETYMKNLKTLYLLIALLAFTKATSAQCNLDTMQVAPTQLEINNLMQEWQSRDTAVYNWQLVLDTIMPPSRVIVASHEIEGFTHYGLIRMPADSNLTSCAIPTLLYLHGSLNGLTLQKVNNLENHLPAALLRDSLIIVAPSFRSEPLLITPQHIYTSQGPSTEMDKDADDALIFLNGAIAHYSQIDTTRITAIGFSRGGNVAYKCGIRSNRIKAMNICFAATNFFDTLLIQDAITATNTSSSPQFTVNNITVNTAMAPYCAGLQTAAESRKRILSWSPAYFAVHLPRINVYHGSLDPFIPISQPHFMQAMMNANNPFNNQMQFFEYPNGAHSLSSISGFANHAANLIREVIRPSIYTQNDSLHSRGSAPMYQWYFNGTALVNETNASIKPIQSGNYQLEFISGSGCSYYSSNYQWIITNVNKPIEKSPKSSLYFNPEKRIIGHKTYVDQNAQIHIVDISGRTLHHQHGASFPFFLDSYRLAAGTYFFIMRNDDTTESIKFILP